MRFQISTTVWVGHTYHEANPAESSIGFWRECQLWCRDMFGQPGDVWEINVRDRYYLNSGKFFFRDSQDLSLFLLRWSS